MAQIVVADSKLQQGCMVCLKIKNSVGDEVCLLGLSNDMFENFVLGTSLSIVNTS